uniref:Branched-chain amino acid ABC transporter permease protein n=1 Tax=Vibrio coralliilyticus TaxID=190893 RepID=M1FVT7_9VIBR|nr:branched-chain amino acid ABC transporter permease [Vibrio coralliilyticus]AFV27408.1 branched-chain amino acid ABC transporter permease protein [Vibrio coralliilyticus]
MKVIPLSVGDKMKLINKTMIGWLAVAIAGFLVLQLAVNMGIISAYYELILVTILINIILAVGLNLIIGLYRQSSLHQTGFNNIGNYTAGIITKYFPTYIKPAWPIETGPMNTIIGANMAGIPTLRRKGDYLMSYKSGVAAIIRISIGNKNPVITGANHPAVFLI